MKKWIPILMTIFLCFVSVPHMSEAKSFGHTSTHFGSGYRSPTTRFRTPTLNRGTSSSGRSFMTHAAAFGAGALFGHMFHPFGGYYNGGYGGFSGTGILIDILIIVAIIWFIRRIFGGRR